jgi:alpha-ketoglutarate-dependent taurine dioxygenase
VLHAAIAATPGVRLPLRRDEAVIVDNRRVLHARESFRDPHRHLLRVRMTTDAVRGIR